jgi:hypothetical protein
MLNRRRLAALFLVTALMGALTAYAGTAAADPPPLRPKATAGGTFHAVTPVRILDTRSGNGAPAAPVGAGAVLEFQVAGRGGIPASGVGSVVLNVTAVDPTSQGYLTVFPQGAPPPTDANPSSLNFVAGQNVANAVTVTVGPTGAVSVFNRNGTTQVLADVVGWYDLTGTGGGRYNPLTPSRIMDTRVPIGPQSGPVGPNTAVDLKVTGAGGVPASGVSAVVVNLTATETTSEGFLKVYPQGAGAPDVSNLNFVAGANRANLVTVGVSASGSITIFNAFGNTHVIVDVMGWYDATGTTGSLFHGVLPTRVADTRPLNVPLLAGIPGTVNFTGQAEVPAGATAVVINATATDQTAAPGFLTIYPADPNATAPNVSNLNWTEPGRTVPNLAIVRLSSTGEAAFLIPLGQSQLLVDVVGYFSTT